MSSNVIDTLAPSCWWYVSIMAILFICLFWGYVGYRRAWHCMRKMGRVIDNHSSPGCWQACYEEHAPFTEEGYSCQQRGPGLATYSGSRHKVKNSMWFMWHAVVLRPLALFPSNTRHTYALVSHKKTNKTMLFSYWPFWHALGYFM